MKKLVRDNYEEIYPNDKYTRASKEVFLNLLLGKIREEVNEFEEKPSKEELADILEIVYQIAYDQDISLEELETARKDKEKAKGSFKKRLIWHS
jgi:predicted house-cleaning noncanonical NTP pyrophosphatase (MazG superfamily)